MGNANTQAKNVAQMIDELGITQAEFARKVGCSASSVTHWRAGDVEIKPSTAKAIERAFPQYRADWIMGSSRFKNSGEELAFRDEQDLLARDEALKALLILAGRSGYDVNLIRNENEVDVVVNHLALNDAAHVNGRTVTAEVTHDDVTTVVDLSELRAIAANLAGFTGTMLDTLVKSKTKED